jgi:hypothetical protein
MFTKIFLAVMLVAAVAAVGVRFGSAHHSPETTTTAATTTKTIAGSFSHPLVFPPVNTNANVSIGIDEACVQILDGPCTNMWTYGGTYPGLTVRRPTGQTTHVTFANTKAPADTAAAIDGGLKQGRAWISFTDLHFAGLLVVPEQRAHCDVKFQLRSFAGSPVSIILPA